MQQKNSSLTVAILLEDIVAAKHLSSAFRKIGIIPHYYSTLEDFWYAVIEDRPVFAIVDVKKMEEKKLKIKDHPFVMEELLPLAFFYNNESRHILPTTYSLFHYGLIQADLSYEKPLSIILQRVNKIRSLRHENEVLQYQLQESSNKSTQLLQGAMANSGQGDFASLCVEMIYKFEDLSTHYEFLEISSSIVEAWPQIEAFSFYCLNSCGEILTSPTLSFPKYQVLPELKVGEICQKGIGFLTQNMVMEVGLKILGDKCLSVPIYGGEKDPQVILLLLPLEANLGEEPHWKLLESLLSGQFARVGLSKNIDQSEQLSEVNPYEFLSSLDQQFYHALGSKKHVVQLNLSALIKKVEKNSQTLFFWNSFYRDFVDRLKKEISYEFTVACYSVSHLAFLVSEEKIVSFSEHLKFFAQKFPYGGYFEKNSFLMEESLAIEVKIFSLSALSYLKLVEGTRGEFENINFEKKLFDQGQDKVFL